MEYAVDCHNLSKTYPGRPPVEAVRGVDLQVRTGECFGVLGPNGAGKTTTIEILEGLLPATSGDIRVLGMQWGGDDRSIRQRIGVSLQETQLADRLTVRETLRLFRAFYDRGISADQAMSAVSLEDKSRTWVRKLSGGQRQRLAVACALVGDPELLFLDEPTTGLDPTSRRQLWDIIQQFRRQGRTILLTTHYMDEAERLCDRVAIFDQGRVIALGTPGELIASLGAENIVEFSIDSQLQYVPSEWEFLGTLPSVQRFERLDTVVRMTVAQVHVALPPLLEQLAIRNVALSGLTTRHASLEDVFVSLTGRQLSDEKTAN